MDMRPRIAEQRRQNSERWCAEYKMHKFLFTDDEEALEDIQTDPNNKGPVKLSKPAPFDPSPAEGGEVRLLADIKDRFQFVYVHRLWNDSNTLIIPFSPYAYPANELELRIGVCAGFLHSVLQIWNTRTVGNKFIDRSWVAGCVSDATRKEVSRMLGNYWRGESLEKLGAAQSRIGMYESEMSEKMLATVREYLDEEMRVFAEIDAADLEQLDGYDEAEA